MSVDESKSAHASVSDEVKATIPTLVDVETIQVVDLERDEKWASNPANPRNWSLLKKWIATSIIALYTFLPPLGSSMMAPGLPEIAVQYHITNSTVLALTLCIFVLSFALAPLVLAPLSELYGRVWILHVSNIAFLAFNLGCAYSKTTGILIGFRFLAGIAGSAPVAIGGGVISDLFSENDRMAAMAIYTLGPLIGPVVGPICGGFIVQTVGIKYVFIVIVAFSGLCALLAVPFLRETYAPVIWRRLQRSQQSADPEKGPVAPVSSGPSTNDKLRYMWLNLSRPVVLLCTNLVCFMLSLYMAFVSGIYYLMFATFGSLFSDYYGFGPGVGGLTYLGLGIGFILAGVLGAKLGDKIYQHLAEKNGGKGIPEHRIPLLILGSIFVPIGLFWYGWSAQAKIHWIMPIIGTGIFGFAFMMIFLPIQLYLADAFAYAASALSAASFIRSTFGFAFPLFGQQMYNALGVGGGNSLLAGLSIVLGIPFPIWIYFYGEKLRMRGNATR